MNGRPEVDPIQRLIQELARLPGIGERTAARLAHYIIRVSIAGPHKGLAADLATALAAVGERVGLCERCRSFATESICSLCSQQSRDRASLCVVESVADLRAIEATGVFRGVYHVMHGALAPLDGIGPEDLQLDELPKRVQQLGAREVIVATNATVEGDATALYLARLLQPAGVKVTRLACGVPMGGELEYLDAATLGRALADRRAV